MKDALPSTDTPNKQIRSSESSSSISRPHDSIDTFLTSILQCKLCSSKVSNSRMCPYCCKLFCERCLDDYLRAQSQQCPHCQTVLQRSSVVKCQNLGKRIEQTLSNNEKQKARTGTYEVRQHQYQGMELGAISPTKLRQSCSQVMETACPHQNGQIQSMLTSTRSSGICHDHSLKYEYYCVTCQTGVCSDCAVLTKKHQAHRMCRLASQKLALDSAVRSAHERISQVKHAALKGKEQKVEELHRTKCLQQQKFESLTTYLKLLSNDIVSNFLTTEVQKRETLLSSSLFSSLEQAIRKYNEFQHILNSRSRSALVRNYSEYCQLIADHTNALAIDFADFQSTSKIIEQNRIRPEYDHKVFYLQKYSQCRSHNQIVFSEPFHQKGIEWRLKIYPNGLKGEESQKSNGSLSNRDDTQKYLAIYLQMSKCEANLLMPFNFKIDVVNQMDRSVRISRTFETQFDEGMCWGYDSFAKISTLYDEKYVDPVQDRIQIELSVRSPTYFHAVMREKRFISRKEQARDHNLKKIHHLRKELGGKCLDRGSDWGLSLTVKALVDPRPPRKRPLHRYCER